MGRGLTFCGPSRVGCEQTSIFVVFYLAFFGSFPPNFCFCWRYINSANFHILNQLFSVFNNFHFLSWGHRNSAKKRLFGKVFNILNPNNLIGVFPCQCNPTSRFFLSPPPPCQTDPTGGWLATPSGSGVTTRSTSWRPGPARKTGCCRS